MFPAYPGFEQLPLRVEVQWQGRARWIVARLEQWPDGNKAVLVCAFEDDKGAGEWILWDGAAPFWAKLPSQTATSAQKANYLADLSASVHWAFRLIPKITEEEQRICMAQIFYLEELPLEPCFVFRFGEEFYWCFNWQINELTLFKVDRLNAIKPNYLREQLLHQWHIVDGDIRFAWQWARWSNQEREFRLSGLGESYFEFHQIMKRILVASTTLWERAAYWSWGINITDSRSDANSRWNSPVPDVENFFDHWQELLIRHFALNYRSDWVDQHECVLLFTLHESNALMASVEQTPTFHEQVEARQQLRDWLQDKAAPDQITRLMSFLDAPA